MHAVFWMVTQPVNKFWLAGETLDPASVRFFGTKETNGLPKRDDSPQRLSARGCCVEGEYIRRPSTSEPLNLILCRVWPR
jgi:hypothetical protein